MAPNLLDHEVDLINFAKIHWHLQEKKEDHIMLDDSQSESSNSRSRSNSSTTGSTNKYLQSDTNSSSGVEQDEAIERALASNETRWLRYSKVIFILILGVAAALSTWAVYRASKNDQDKAYRTRFTDFANEVITVSDLHANAVVDAYNSLALMVTASVNASAWPNVVVPGFEGLARNIMSYTDANFVNLTPFVYLKDKASYEAFVFQNAPIWIKEAADIAGVEVEPQFVPFIFDITPEGDIIPGIPRTTPFSPDEPYYYVVHQTSPVEFLSPTTNFNGFTVPLYMEVQNVIVTKKAAAMSPIENIEGDPDGDPGQWPTGYLGTPVFREIGNTDDIVGVLTGSIGFQAFLSDLLPEDADPLYAIIETTCNQTLTYLIEGPDVVYLGARDLHESKDDIFVSAELTAFETLESCKYSMRLHSSNEFYDRYHTNQPTINAVAIGMTFVATAILFILYDVLVERRQRRVMKTANRSVAIVSSLFPTKVRDRLLKDDESQQGPKTTSRTLGKVGRGSMAFGGADAKDPSLEVKSKPIADLFTDASVLFADIVGFTAWASMREPRHVFELLESVYSSFDKLAKKLHVFKVETIGDCYVAACGLPEPMEKHAVVITRFAKLCIEKMKQVVVDLSFHLGPDTSSLTLRIGIHTGPVTAGVLRGEKSRFQLFGDTVNTASRIESTGMPNRIQVSQEMADELTKAGKEAWIEEREDKIEAKGKGTLQTYWIVRDDQRKDTKSEIDGEARLTDEQESTRRTRNSSLLSISSDVMTGDDSFRASSIARRSDELAIRWNADVIKSFVKKIVAARKQRLETSMTQDALTSLEVQRQEGSVHIYPLDEVQEVIALPNEPLPESALKWEDVNLSDKVMEQIDDYVSTIAAMYRSNPFHNFAHCSHVVQSTMKLLSRIVAAEEIDYKEMTYRKQAEEARHEHSFGITSDPITQFACIFAALIHDVDHLGVPNAQLVLENTRIAQTYNNKSVAEQNSLDLAWDLLMDEQYADFRACIYSNEEEFQRFRQLLVNMVMATDIMDKDLKELRNKRWETAFSAPTLPESESSDDPVARENINRMATIVIEHLIQASDVAHTMQHWHVYIRWNERLFHEMYKAFKLGRAASDPSLNWYKGELGFFDFYIIPLAKKLKECKIFGVSSDEYLNYAKANRKEWEARGQDMVAKYLASYNGP